MSDAKAVVTADTQVAEASDPEAHSPRPPGDDHHSASSEYDPACRPSGPLGRSA